MNEDALRPWQGEEKMISDTNAQYYQLSIHEPMHRENIMKHDK
jgi:hypothetical protein